MEPRLLAGSGIYVVRLYGVRLYGRHHSFPSATMDGCLFHFCQATLNWVRKNGLKKAYEEGERDPVTGRYNPSQVRVWVQRLQHLAFVPINDVPSSFTYLCDEIHSELCLDDFLAYFSSTWVQGFEAVQASVLRVGTCWTELHVT